MSEKITAGPISGCNPSFKEAVCIQTDKVYDSCREKDCIEDLRVYFTRCGQEKIEHAINVRIKNVEVIWVNIDVEPVPFNDGFYSVNIKYFFKVTIDAFAGLMNPTTVTGLATFDKVVVLFGSEGEAKKFTSKFIPKDHDTQTWMKSNLPKGIVEVVDPIGLSAKIVDHCHHHEHDYDDIDIAGVPDFVSKTFEEDLIVNREGRRVLVSIGLFTIVKIEREVQLLIPAFDFCIPDEKCLSATQEDPCDLFRKIRFPFDEFFPPQKFEFEGAEEFIRNRRECK